MINFILEIILDVTVRICLIPDDIQSIWKRWKWHNKVPYPQFETALHHSNIFTMMEEDKKTICRLISAAESDERYMYEYIMTTNKLCPYLLQEVLKESFPQYLDKFHKLLMLQ